MDFERLNAVAEKLMKHRKAHTMREQGSIYDHGQRVAKLVITLRRAVVPGDESMDDILRLAGIFHDIGKGIEPHAAFGAPIMRQAVKGIVTEEEAREAARLIESHCDRRPSEPVHDVWVRLIQDADLLDHIGTYNIWMDIQYYAHTGEGVLAPSVTRRVIANFSHQDTAARPAPPAGRPHPARTGGARADRQGSVEPGDRRPPGDQSAHGEDPREQPAVQAERPRPRPAGHRRLRERHRRARNTAGLTRARVPGCHFASA